MGELEPKPNTVKVSYTVPFSCSSGREAIIPHTFFVDEASLDRYAMLIAEFLDWQRKDIRIKVTVGTTNFEHGEPVPQSSNTEDPFYKEFMEEVNRVRSEGKPDLSRPYVNTGRATREVPSLQSV